MDRGGEPELVGATGAWGGASALEAPVEFGGRRLGRIALAARRGSQPYSTADRAALEQAAHVAAQAILQDGAAR